jgi:ribosomal protein S18 acetylase RimI-like enzyme
MMDEIEKRLAATGCPKINLQVRAWNEEVVEFYKTLGYKVEPHTSMGKLLE